MKRRICFVTGTRAEFGLMRTVLQAIQDHPKLQLQLVVTGMHLHRRHGMSIEGIRKDGWKIDAIVPWKLDNRLAEQTGLAMSHLARTFERLKSDVILVVGDRVEPFAAASAAHIAQKAVAHVHGGDRAPGQIDDSLRHAITKLSHIHFPATATSAQRLLWLGEDRSRIHLAGSPGVDGITDQAASLTDFPKLTAGQYALILLHPTETDSAVEYRRAQSLFHAVRRAGVDQAVVIYPNNDPGSDGIIRAWREQRQQMTYLLKDVSRPEFLGLLRDAAVLVGNSSSGIIEAASFGTRVVNIGPRQLGRDRSQNVTDVTDNPARITAAVRRAYNAGPWRGKNVYGGRGTGKRIADALASITIDQQLLRKLIAY